MLIVASLGGNAVSPLGKEGNIPQQFATTRTAIKPLADLILAGHQIVITHGNGPQAGVLLRRVEIAAQHNIYPLPLDTIGADTQAGMGYMISQCLMNELATRGKPRLCSTVITTVRVDKDDPAFKNPTKPIGSFLAKEKAEEHAKKDGWNVVEDAGRGWRRVVPSPIPREIVELDVIHALVKAGHIVISCGGGGVPVVRDEKGQYTGVEGVIDKDRTSALLANSLNADMLALLTGVDQVQSDYGKPTAKAYSKMTISEARALAKAGQFPAGSMGPKIESAIGFVERSTSPNSEVMITSIEQIGAALEGKNGTRIIRG